MGVGLRQGCALSPILFVIFMDRISKRSRGGVGFQFGGLRIALLLFADDVVLMAPSASDLQHSLADAPECEAAGMRISTSKSEVMVLWRRRKEFKYLGILFSSEGTREREMGRRIGAAGVVLRSLCRKTKLSIYRSIFIPTLSYSQEGWVMTERMKSQVKAAKIGFLRRAAGVSLRDRVKRFAF